QAVHQRGPVRHEQRVLDASALEQLGRAAEHLVIGPIEIERDEQLPRPRLLPVGVDGREKVSDHYLAALTRSPARAAPPRSGIRTRRRSSASRRTCQRGLPTPLARAAPPWRTVNGAAARDRAPR